jgi:hypothetical protein
MLRCVALTAGFLAFVLASVPAPEARGERIGGAIRARITRIDPPPTNGKDPDLFGTLHVEWTPDKPGALDTAFVRIDKRTKLTLDGKEARFEDLRPGMRVEFVPSGSALIYPPLYYTTEVHVFSEER